MKGTKNRATDTANDEAAASRELPPEGSAVVKPKFTKDSPAAKWLKAEFKKHLPRGGSFMESAPVEIRLLDRIRVEAVMERITALNGSRTPSGRIRALNRFADCYNIKATAWVERKLLLHAPPYLLAGESLAQGLRRLLKDQPARTAELCLRRRILHDAVVDYSAAFKKFEHKSKEQVAAEATFIERIEIVRIVFGRLVADAQKGRCMCCGRELLDPVSIRRGIGPECNTMGAKIEDELARLGIKLNVVLAPPEPVIPARITMTQVVEPAKKPAKVSKLLPRVTKLPPLSTVASEKNPIIQAKLFLGGMTWYVAAAQPDTNRVSRFADDHILWVYAKGPDGGEWGQQSLRELEQMRIFGGLKVERDRCFKRSRFQEVS